MLVWNGPNLAPRVVLRTGAQVEIEPNSPLKKCVQPALGNEFIETNSQLRRAGGVFQRAANAVPAGGAFIDSFDDDAAFLAPGSPFNGAVLFVTVQLRDIDGNGLGQALLRYRTCEGDGDSNGEVGQDDLDLILGNFNTSGYDCYTNGDVDGDGDVDQEDYDSVLFNFGCGQST